MLNRGEFFGGISKMTSLKIFYTASVAFMVYNIPIMAFDYVFSEDQSFGGIYLVNLFKIFYRVPMGIVLYFYTTNSLIKNLQNDKITVPPNPLFSDIIIGTNYLLIYSLGYLVPYNFKLLTDILITSICISQLSYNFIDNSNYNFQNFMNFFNSNIAFFLTISGLYSFIELNYLYGFEIIGFYLYILVCFPILSNHVYSTTPSLINLFYFSELLWGVLVNITS